MIPETEELISIVVPAYNAERYLAETLTSLVHQTHRNLEIIVVDDGSRDSTTRIVQGFAERDLRIRMISQANAGVAHARNRGLREAKGRFVAPCDADDLWSREKLSLQIAAWRRAPCDVGLVYTAYAVIDAESRVHRLDPVHIRRGQVFNELCRGNFVGNASSAMMRRDDVLAVGGYDPGLRAKKAQGCEDLKLYLQIASTQAFEAVEARCIGYRQTNDNMSSDIFQMLRSFEVVASEFVATHPANKPIFDEGKVWLMQWLRNRAFESGNYTQAANMSVQMLPRNASLGLKTAYWDFILPHLKAARRTLNGWPAPQPSEIVGRPYLGKAEDQPLWILPPDLDDTMPEPIAGLG